MPKKRKYTKELRFNVDEELHAKLFALAERRGEAVAELCRRVLEEAAEQKAAEDGIDVITQVVRKVMSETLKPLENRLAAMQAKGTIASATTMYHMQHVLIGMNKDVRVVHEEARKKAVNYLKTDMDKLMN